MRARLGLLVVVSALSCGGSGPGKGSPADAESDAPRADAPDDALAEGGAAPADREAPSAEAGHDAAPDGPRDVGPSDAGPVVVVDATVSSVCGEGTGRTCPVTYLGTAAIAGTSMTGFTAALAPDETLYLGGNLNAPTDLDPTAGLDVHTPTGYGDAFVTKLGPTGAYGGSSTFPGSDYWGAGVWGLSATTTSVIAVGGFNGTIDLDPGPRFDMHEADPQWSESFAVKLTAAGAFGWGRVTSSSGDGSVGWSQVVAAADGSALIGGGYNGAVDLNPGVGTRPSPNAHGVLVMHLDASGNLAWIRTMGGDACTNPEIDGVAQGPDGAAWFVGLYGGTCAFDQPGPSAPQTDTGMFLASLTPAGQVRGLWTWPGSFTPIGVSLAPDGSVYVGGHVYAPAPGEAAVDFDPAGAVAASPVLAPAQSFVLKLGQAGAFEWVHLLPGDLYAATFAATPDDGVLVAGGPHAAPVGMFILGLDAQGHESWRLFAGGRTTEPTALLVSAKGFVVAGTQATPGDLDPSTGVDRFEGPISFVSRYANSGP